MIVVIAGMYRSGSTFSFNIAREILPGTVDVVSANSITSADQGRSPEHHLVVKTHSPDQTLIEMVQAGKATCICTYRKPEYAVASWMDTFGFGFSEAVETIRSWLCWRQTLCAPVLDISYDTIEERPLLAIMTIQRYLLGKVDMTQAEELKQRYSKARIKQEYDALTVAEPAVDIGFSYYDPNTFFHRRHVSSVGKRMIGSTLNTAQIAIVRRELADLIDANGEFAPRRTQSKAES
jgi:hypothetical protein